ncbi:twin-arginine translocation protein TatB [Candidatus Nitrosoglobus terrae]|uniref:Twin-arginine translocation protein TatB n=1 Tax=Candidatus Nitrosoglobus terrae TaxID=1630141 RepID=A0A1Q2SJV1_9GAMM|nr:Sec-independent protein translocase protein TatB [Candidatus Nitrosoglobus terrae]BAW79404.1 twin-arginine translocation protein TatB [Candidatus Nitrosoglobus terrae]
MFDIGFWEIIVVLVILLLVVGPERIPIVVRTTALWVRKIRRLISQIKQEVEQELRTEELQQSLRKNIDLPDSNETNNSSPTSKSAGNPHKK